MPVCKVIFRLDYLRLNFAILDSPGTVMRIMRELGDKFWSEFNDAPQERSVAASFQDNKKCSQFRRLTVGPYNLDFLIEDAKGIDFSSLESNDSYFTIFRGIQDLRDKFKMDEFRRAGLRFFYLSSIGSDKSDLNPVFEKLIDASLLEKIRSSMGAPTDYGINLDGSDNDKIKYHLRFGPYTKDGSVRFFEKVHEQINEKMSWNFICDLDLYEEKFALKGTRPIAWTKPLILKAQNLLSDIETHLSARL